MPQSMGTYRNPRALCSALATLGTLQPRALGFLNRIVPLVSFAIKLIKARAVMTSLLPVTLIPHNN